MSKKQSTRPDENDLVALAKWELSIFERVSQEVSKRLLERIEELEARCRNEHQRFLEFRCMTSGCGLGHTVCRDCGGAGRKMYGSTATWRGGIGGQAFTSDICDRCWGSGFEDRPWISVREHEKLEATIERVRGLPEKLRDVAEDVGLSGNDEDANRIAHITDELEAILRGENNDE